MQFTCRNAPNVRYNTMEKLKQSSILDSITTKRVYGNQMLYFQAVIFQTKAIASTHAIFILIEQIRHIDINKDKNKESLKQRQNFWILTLETPKSLNALIKNLVNIVASIILLCYFSYFHLSNVR